MHIVRPALHDDDEEAAEVPQKKTNFSRSKTSAEARPRISLDNLVYRGEEK